MSHANTPTRKLTRSSSDTVIAGVAGGLAEYLEIDSTVIRVIFIILSFAGGFGFLVYLILALVIPPASAKSEPTSTLDQKVSELHEEIKQKAKDWQEKKPGERTRSRGGRSLIGWALLLVGAFLLLERLNIVDFNWIETYWPALLVAAGFLIIASS